RAGGAHVVLALEHQCPGRAHADAVAAVHARRLRQRRIELGRDVGVEAATCDADREGVLRIDAARLHALVAKDASRVVAYIELVVDLDGLRRARDTGAETRRHRPTASHPALHLR